MLLLRRHPRESRRRGLGVRTGRPGSRWMRCAPVRAVKAGAGRATAGYVTVFEASDGRNVMDLNAAVQERYSAAAHEHESGLCCPVDFDPALLEIIPRPVLERDYGCGDTATHVRPGEAVLDLGCGGGKVCFITSQMIGEAGRVIGVDVT